MTVTVNQMRRQIEGFTFGRLARNSREHYFRLDRNGIIRGYYGASPSDTAMDHPLAGTSLPSLFPPGTKAEFKRAISRTVAENRLTMFEFPLALASGTETFAARIIPLSPRLLMASIHNVSARTRAQQALRLVEERFATVFSRCAAGIALTSPDDGFIRVNAALCTFLGYDAAEIMRLRLPEVTHPEDHEPFPAAGIEEADGSAILTREQRFRRKDGSMAWGHTSITWFFDEEGRQVYAVHVIQDITEHKRSEEEIARLNACLSSRAAELETANRELEAFNHRVSHDLRAPLTGIAGYSEMILCSYGESLTDQCRGYLEQIFTSSRRMGFLINALLNLSRISRSEIRGEHVDLSTLARELALEMTLQEPQRGVEFVIAPQMRVTGDERLLRVVLQNLLDNAWKYTGKTEGARIECGVEEREGWPVYFVRDNGAGFDPALAGRVFEPFQRLHDEEEFPGSGIGLTTVERIIKRHGGRVWAEGEPGRGACISFTLPLS